MWTQEIYYYTDEMSMNSRFTITMSGITHCDGTYNNIRKNSPFHLIEYVQEGEGNVIINSCSYEVKKGEVYFLPKGSNHQYFSNDKNPWRKIWFTATGSLADYLVGAYNFENINVIRNCNINESMEKVLNLLKTKPSDINLLAPLLFHEVLLTMASAVDINAMSHSPLALRIKNYLDTHIESHVSLREISRAVYRSPSQIIRIFKKEFNLTPYEYLLNCRLKTAMLMLQNTFMSVKEIAYKLDFADEHYFSSFFKEKTEMTPSKYREKYAIKKG
jgi:AraC-like DNA-binding protein